MHVKKKVKHDAAFFKVTRDDAGGSSNDIHSLGGGGGGGGAGGEVAEGASSLLVTVTKLKPLTYCSTTTKLQDLRYLPSRLSVCAGPLLRSSDGLHHYE